MKKIASWKSNTPSENMIIGIKMMSPRLTGLDEQRCLSMADEGGAAAAEMETQDDTFWAAPIKEDSLFNEDNLRLKNFWTSLRSVLEANQKLFVYGGLAGAGVGLYLIRNKRRFP